MNKLSKGALPESVPCANPSCDQFISAKDLAGFPEFDKEAIKTEEASIPEAKISVSLVHYRDRDRYMLAVRLLYHIII